MPNTVVKLTNAESTWLEAAWEDRKLLINMKAHLQRCAFCFAFIWFRVQGSRFRVVVAASSPFFIGRCPKVVFKSRVTSHNNDTSSPLETEVPQRDFRVWPNPKRRLACPLRRLPVRPNGPRRRRRMQDRVPRRGTIHRSGDHPMCAREILIQFYQRFPRSFTCYPICLLPVLQSSAPSGQSIPAFGRPLLQGGTHFTLIPTTPQRL